MTIIISYLKKLYSYAGPVLLLNVIGMGMMSIVEGVGILLIIPLISVTGIVEVQAPEIPFTDWLAVLHEIPSSISLLIILSIILAIVVSQNVVQRNVTIRNVKIVQGFVHHIRIDMYRKLLSSKWEFFLQNRKTDLINLFTTELQKVSGGIMLVLQLITSIVFTCIYIGLAFWLAPSLTLIVLTCGLILAWISRRFIKRSKDLGHRTIELSKAYVGGITDQLNGMKDIKSNRLEGSRLAWLRSLTENMLEERVQYVRVHSASQMLYNISSSVLIVVFIYVSLQFFRGSLEQILLIMLIFGRLWPKLSGIQSSVERMANIIPALEALTEFQQKCLDVAELPSRHEAQPTPVLKRGLECRAVYFRYHREQDVYALSNVTINIQPKQMTAIVGHSGAGKSTLIDLLMGLLQPERGMVLLDGQPLEGQTLRSLRDTLSYVPQDPFLFHGTIRENLTLVAPEATEFEMWDALHQSAAADFVRELPQQLDTLIGDRGIKLSGGERQRIVLARALLKKPTILILDEATSALDTENESLIQAALEKLRGNITIILIAHRLSTIQKADQIFVMQKGSIVQLGNYDELSEDRHGRFYQLLRKQGASAS